MSAVRLVIVSLVVLLAACASNAPSRGVLETGDDAVSTPDGLNRVTIDAKGVLFVKPDHQLGSYSKFLIQPVRVTYTRRSSRFPREETVELARELQRALAEKVVAQGMKFVAKPEACALSMRASLIDLELKDVDPGGGNAYIESYGQVTVVLEYWDSISEEPILRFGQRHNIKGGAVQTKRPSLDRMRQLFDTALVDIDNTLRSQLPLSEGEPSRTCPGSIRERFPPQKAAATAG